MSPALDAALVGLITYSYALLIPLTILVTLKAIQAFSGAKVEVSGKIETTLKGAVASGDADNIYTELAAGKNTKAAEANAKAAADNLKAAEINERTEAARLERVKLEKTAPAQ